MRRLLPVGEIVFIFRARLKERVVVVQESLAIIGIAVGVALLFASQVASQSLDGSVRQLSQQLVGGAQYQLDARGPQGFSEAVMRAATKVRGVQAAIPLLEQQASVFGRRGQAAVDLIGADPRFAHLGGPLLRRFSARQLAHQQVIALPAPLARSIGAEPLQTVKLQTGTRVIETLLGTTLGSKEAGGLVNSQVAIAPIAYVQKLLDEPGRISRLFVKVAPDEKNQALAGLRALASMNRLSVVPATFDAELFRVASAPAQQGESLFSGISAIVGFLFAFNAMLLTVGERRRLIRALRRRGSTRAMILQTLIFDALVIGCIGSLLGLLIGEVLSANLFHSQPGYLAFAFPVGSQRIVTASTIAEAVGAGMLAAVVGVLVPVREIVARPLRSQVETERPPRGWTTTRIVVGLSCLAATTAILAFRPQSAVAGVVTLVLACLALLPFLFAGIIACFDRLQRPLPSTSTRLAVSELGDPQTRIRSLAVAATGAVAVCGSVAVAGAQRNLQSGLNATAHEWNQAAEIWVSPSGVNNTLGTTPFSTSVEEALRDVPGVASVRPYRGAFLNIGKRRVWIIAPTPTSNPIPPGQLVVGAPTVANERLRAHGWAVISEALANELGVHVGDSFVLPAPFPTRFRVAGLSTNGGWPPGAIVMNASDFAHAWGSSAVSALNVMVSEGYTASETRLAITKALGTEGAGLAVQTAAERERQWKRISHQGLARLSQISHLVLLAAVLAMAGVMTSLLWQRRERIAYLKRTGNTRGLLWRSLLFESGVLLGSGCLIGAVFGLYGQLLISHALATVTGFPIAIGVGAFIAIFSFMVVSASALAIVAAPGYFAVRVRPTMVRPS